MFELDVRSRVPIYEQLKSKIIELIMLDVLKADTQLPSVRILARELGINPNTVQKAYQDLEREGVIYSVTGKGSFIAEGSSLNEKLKKQAIDRLKALIEELKTLGFVCREVCEIVQNVYSGEVGQHD